MFQRRIDQCRHCGMDNVGYGPAWISYCGNCFHWMGLGLKPRRRKLWRKQGKGPRRASTWSLKEAAVIFAVVFGVTFSAAHMGGFFMDGCVIKGNISYRTGERIYHMPSDRYYDETVINTGAGERWFCSQFEAILAGWRRAKV